MKKTKDGRIIDKRVDIDKKLIKAIINEIKSYNHLTWVNLSNSLGISEHTLRVDWIQKNNTIPLKIFIKLIRLHPKIKINNIINKIKIKEPFWGQKIGIKSKNNKNIKLPNINTKEFSEFYGVLIGDGCIYSNLSGICISGHSILDKKYLENHIANLIFKLFNVKPRFYYSKKQNSMNCVVYSKKIAEFLIRMGFPKGKKINHNLIIPKIFFNNKIMIKNCLKGIYDTDGSIYPNKKNIIIDITIKNKHLLNSCIHAFKEIKLNVKYTKNRIYLYGKENAKVFFNVVGSSNYKHLIKYKNYIEKGFVLKSKEIENYLKGELNQ